MSEKQWPPAWWPYPLKDDSWLAVIPYMDALQWLYESAKEVAKIIPHQPPVMTRDVPGYILSLSNTREKVVLGSVGYNAETRKVSITTNTIGGSNNKTIEIDVSIIFPMLTVLLSRLPWDVVGEMNNIVTSGMTDAEKVRYASNGISDNKMIIRWLTDKVRMTAGDNGIALPALDGSYASTDKMDGTASLVPSLSNLVLYNVPVMDYCQAIYDAVMELVETINHHPPAAVFPVITRALYPVFIYRLIDGNGEVIYYGSAMPDIDAITGNTLQIWLRPYSDDSVVDWNNLDDSEKTFDTPNTPVSDYSILLVEKAFNAAVTKAVYTSTTDESDPNVKNGTEICLITSNGTLVKSTVSDVAQGHPAEGEPGDPDYKEGEPTTFTLNIATTSDALKDDEVVISAATLSGLHGSGTAVQISAGVDGKQDSLAEGAYVAFEQNELAGFIYKVVTQGTDAPETDDTGGTGEAGTNAVAMLYLYTNEADGYTLRAGDYTCNISGVDYNFTVSDKVRLVPAPALVYTASLAGPSVIQLAPESIDFQVATPLYSEGTFFRWKEASDVTYIGRELNLQLGTAGTGVDRYVLGRIKYRYKRDKSGHYRYVYGDDEYKLNKDTGYGNCHPMDIEYNAAKKIVTFVDRLGGDKLEMRLSSCAWFVMQLLMLIPVTVI